MADPAELLKRITWLHHFTDTRNLPKIKELGGLYSRQELKNMGVNSYPLVATSGASTRTS